MDPVSYINYEVLWDYCLEHDLCMPDGEVYYPTPGLHRPIYLPRTSISGFSGYRYTADSRHVWYDYVASPARSGMSSYAAGFCNFYHPIP